MKFEVFGGFEVKRNKKTRQGIFDKEFWIRVFQEDNELAGACGCYVFALKNGLNYRTWYIGKTEKNSFKKECFQPHKIVIFNDILLEHNGTPVLFFLPRLTGKGNKFCKPSKRGYPDIDFLESMLIGIALKKSPNLSNIKKTKFLREMVVPSVINAPQAPPKHSEIELRNALGLQA